MSTTIMEGTIQAAVDQIVIENLLRQLNEALDESDNLPNLHEHLCYVADDLADENENLRQRIHILETALKAHAMTCPQA